MQVLKNGVGYMRDVFQNAWFDHITLPNIDYKEIMGCCEAPVVIADGIMLGYKAKRANITYSWVPLDTEEEVYGSKFQDIILLKKNATRAAVLSFADGPGLSHQEHLELKREIGDLACLCERVQMVDGKYRSLPSFQIAERKSLLVSLEEEKSLIEHNLVLLGLLRNVKQHFGESIPSQVFSLLATLCDVARSAFIPYRDGPSSVVASSLVPMEDELGFFTSGQFFGRHHQVKRRLRKYATNPAYRKEEECTKHSYIPRQLTAGTYIMWCVEHEEAVGFLVMPHAESPRTAFECLYTCWDPDVLRGFYYDNGCNAEQYALNREPLFFKNVSRMIDSMHARGHVNCLTAYKSSNFSFMTDSSLAEQRNSKLAQLKTEAVFMNQFNFLFYVRHYLYELNMQKRKG
ncbi:hypothetical protein BSKO_02724 [Bryopsis sp. KO-2023]|nr:hypothetical protein BSKO_02724 [Bryopsis sp. KO-2023]